MIKKILIGVVVVIALVLAFAATQPSEFKISREIKIAATPEAIFPHVNDFHKFNVWNPWAKKDPKMEQAYEGAESGVGSVSKWKGNSEVGEGSMTIVESQPNTLIRMNLDFIAPMKANDEATFTFTPEGAETKVTWSMTGHQPFIGKVICLFMDMQKMVGGDFDTGLAALKSIVEAAPAAAPAAPAEATPSAQ